MEIHDDLLLHLSKAVRIFCQPLGLVAAIWLYDEGKLERYQEADTSLDHVDPLANSALYRIQLTIDDEPNGYIHLAPTLQTEYSTAQLEQLIEMLCQLVQTIMSATAAGQSRVVRLKRFEEAEREETQENTLEKAVTYIQANLHRPLTLEEVAESVHFSQFYFSKLFKKEMGMTFVSYLHRERVLLASQLLTDTNYSIQEVGKRVGLPQPSYFCKVFKDQMYHSPNTYRQLRRRKSVVGVTEDICGEDAAFV